MGALRLALLCTVLGFAPINRADAPPEVRGTWLTTTANTAIASPQNTAATMKRLREIGLNTVYVECWKNGYTEFPSDVMTNAIGVSMKVNPSEKNKPAIQRDLLQECVIEAHRNQMLCIAWFEYGFMAAHKDTNNELRARKDWLVLNADGGEVAKNGFVWLNPLHPDAQKLLIGIVVEAVKKYDLDGIQLDDRIVWPSLEMGYDDFTKKLYAAEHDGHEPPRDIKDAEWMAWRQKKVEAFAKRFVREVRAAGGKDLILSLSPGPHPWALENYLIDWPAWSRWPDNPTWDEYIPQVYRMNYERFAEDFQQQFQFMGERKSDLIAGIRLVGDGPDLPSGDATKSAQLTRDTATAGHCWWFSRGVLDVQREAIEKFYDVQQNGQAPHPKRGFAWRPPPVIGQRDAHGNWTVDVPNAGRYLELHRIDGEWRRVGTTSFPKGSGVLMNDTGDATELVLDRRRHDHE